MPLTESASAVVVRIPAPPRLARLRDRWDANAAAGVPTHVTILYPFLPASHLAAGVRRELATVAAAQAPFVVTFAKVGRFPGVVYLAPRPSVPFLRLTEAVTDRFPSHPPYGGAYDAIVPHLTIADIGTDRQDEVAAEAAEILPFRHRVTTIEVIVEGDDGRWRPRWRIALGARP
jgi:2'-5' RNA ligase